MSSSSCPDQNLVTFESTRNNNSSSKECLHSNNAEFLTETDEDASPLIVLSVIFQGHKMGAAYYDLDTCHFCLLPDHIETSSTYSILRLLLRQTQPCTIITNSRVDENILSILKEISELCL
ncbi:unnamed protein product [Larinioides sclopetarius]|uniref:MutS-like protein n=1 Tax=Larinioides sclopetarius TaxID=280406 RepID=A0AAV2BCY9_9ARAC